MKFLVLSALLFISFNVLAHEGAHGPAQKMAPHGGVLKDGKEFMAELVQDSSGIKIYLLQHDAKPIDTKDVKIDSKKVILTDAKKKTVNFELVTEKDFVLLQFEKSKSYRYNLILPVTYNNSQDNFNWKFEPQSN